MEMIKLEMLYDEYRQYFWEAMSNLGVEDEDQFAELLGMRKQFIKWKYRPTSEDRPMSHEFKNLLKALSGPHGKTLLKVYRIKHGLVKG